MSFMRLAVTAAILISFGSAASAATVVTTLDGSQGWVEVNSGGGDSEIVDLTGEGGDLENNQPTPTGALKQTTTLDVNDKSEVAYGTNFGTVSDIFDEDLAFSYSFYKSSGSPNAAASPSLKLLFQSTDPNYNGDGYGQLIYEPYWQPDGTPSNPSTDQWIMETIDLTTGVFWSTGMFGDTGGQDNSDDFKTLSEWQAALDAGFGNASLTAVGIGIGSYNQDQNNYFDNVAIAGTNGPNGTYDFEPAPIPVPAALPLLLGAVGGLALMRRRARP